ncbi:MAG: hypothetical protein DRQ10_00685 [Candidatus Hydrothermota bacterium]|nr:MAG: hypothetical protein DRQ10_00685 [Candidatus Hydrothermae bacterium]
MLRKILTVVNVVLAAVLIYILIQPKLRARREVHADLVYRADITALPVFVAKANGYFDSLKVIIDNMKEPAKPGEDVLDVLKGKYIAGIGTDWGFFAFRAKDRPGAYRVVINATSTISMPYTALLVSPDSKIKSYKDLEGKSVGFLRDTKHDQLFTYILKKEGVNADAVRMIALMRSEMPTVFSEEGMGLDAVIAVEPYRTILIKSGAKVLEDGVIEKKLLSPLPDGVIFTSIANLELKREATRRVINALNMAVDFIRKNPDSAVAILRSEFELPDTVVIPLPTFEKYDEVDFGAVQRYLNTLKDAEILFYEVPADSFRLLPEEIKK